MLARDGAEATPVSGVLRLREGRAGRAPLVLVHPIGGTSILYRELADALGGDRAVLGLQAPGVEGEAPPLDSVQALAAHHLTTLERQGFEPPTLLAGISLGGSIAFEMASLLERRGRPPAAVVLLDSPGPGELPGLFEDDAELFAMVFGGDDDALTARLRRLEPEQMLREVLRLARGDGAAALSLAELRVFRAVWRAHGRALLQYVPGPYDGEVHYFKAQTTVPPHPEHPERPWRRLLGDRLRLHHVAGNHESIIEAPHVDALAHQLTALLDHHERIGANG